MTDKEKDLLNKIIDVMKGFGDIQEEAIAGGWDKYDGDNSELCYHIHSLQNWVLANAASRAHPEMYRPFGAKHRK